MELITKSAEETQKFGEKMATDLIRDQISDVGHPKATVVALMGTLGSGKTTFSQGFGKGLGIKKRIISPTFILMRKYNIPPSTGHRTLITNFYHIDLYRLGEGVETEAQNLGLFEIWKNPKNIVLIEWADKIENILPEKVIRIKFEILNEFERKIVVD